MACDDMYVLTDTFDAILAPLLMRSCPNVSAWRVPLGDAGLRDGVDPPRAGV